MAKDKNIELERRQIYLANTVIRKKNRKEKRAFNKRYNFNNRTWYENGVCKQNCEMGGSCDFPCNGDC